MRGESVALVRDPTLKIASVLQRVTIVVAIKTAPERLALGSVWHSRPELNIDYVCLYSVCLYVCNLVDSFLVRDIEMNA